MRDKALFHTDIYKKHLAIALKAHKDQRTPHGLPYAFHVLSVSVEVIAALPYENITMQEADIAIACALLHDVCEDTDYDLEAEGLESEILEGVEALTKNTALPKAEQMLDSIKRLQLLAPYIQMVKIADRITNLDTPPPHWSDEKKRKYQEEARLLLHSLKSPSMYLSAKLEDKIEHYDRYCR